MRTSWLLVSIAVHGAAVTAAVGFGTYSLRPADRPPAKIEFQAQREQPLHQSEALPLQEVETEDVQVVEPLQVARVEDQPVEPEPAESDSAEPERQIEDPLAESLRAALLERVLVPSQRRHAEAVPAPAAAEAPVEDPVEDPAEDPVEATAAAAKPASTPQAFVAATRSDNRPPEYPKRELRLGREGTVVVRCFVSAAGSVQDVALHKPSRYPGLNRAALRAARGWTFEPARRDGVAVASHTDVDVEFRLIDR